MPAESRGNSLAEVCGLPAAIASPVAEQELEGAQVEWLRRTGLAARDTWDLNFPTRVRTHVPCIGRQILNH